MKSREQWKSKIGFIWAAIGSAVGLGSIWRFPYIVGDSGGAAFVLIFIICLVAISLPVFIAEITIGRRTHTSPSGAFKELGKSKWWQAGGKLTIITGFIVSSFYSVIVGLTLGYFFEALMGNLTQFTSGQAAADYYDQLTMSPFWTVGWHFAFMLMGGVILYLGVQKGIESWNKILMPLLMLLLVILVIKGLNLPNSSKALAFLFKVDFRSITPAVVLMALGQAFFGLSLGQGTMVTYGSYLTRRENLLTIGLPIASSIIFVSLLAGISIFSIVFSADMPPASGPNLMFKTLPVIFSKMNGGYIFACLFFLLVFLAGLTSQISAMQPAIAYFCDEKGFSRHDAVVVVSLGAFLLGIPSALALGIWQHWTLFGMDFFNFISYISINILVPIGGLFAVLMVGWKWGIPNALEHIGIGSKGMLKKHTYLKGYIKVSLRYIAPVVIIVILFNLIGVV